jgi:ABC-2 type transport system permease protein
MSAPPLSARDLSAKRAPGLGGINLTILGLEIRKLVRNRRTVVFAVVLPIVLFLLIGTNKAYAHEPDGHGNVSAFLMVSMALYGAVLATTAGGAMVAIERALGWSRQLRLTPLSPAAYIVIKMLTSMVLGLISVLAVFAMGKITGVPKMMPGYGYLWILTGACVWVGSLVFAAFGLFLGYLLPSENVMQFMGLIMVVLSFAGGLFYPLNQFPHLLQVIAKFTPLYGLNELVHAPLLGGSVHLAWIANAVAWLALFTAGAIWRFRKDTARV